MSPSSSKSSASVGPWLAMIRTSMPVAARGTMMSENRIAASTSIRRTGCSATSAAASGSRVRVRTS
jgi:hypothetical protein